MLCLTPRQPWDMLDCTTNKRKSGSCDADVGSQIATSRLWWGFRLSHHARVGGSEVKHLLKANQQH